MTRKEILISNETKKIFREEEMIKYWKDVDILDISKRLDDFVIEMITQHYLMEEGKEERVKA